MNGNRRGLTLDKEKRATTDDGQKLQLCTRAALLGRPIEIVFFMALQGLDRAQGNMINNHFQTYPSVEAERVKLRCCIVRLRSVSFPCPARWDLQHQCWGFPKMRGPFEGDRGFRV